MRCAGQQVWQEPQQLTLAVDVVGTVADLFKQPGAPQRGGWVPTFAFPDAFVEEYGLQGT